MKTISAIELKASDILHYSGRVYTVQSVAVENGIVSVDFGGEYPMDFYEDSQLSIEETVYVGESHLGVTHLLEGFSMVCKPTKSLGRVKASVERVTCGRCKNTKHYKALNS